MIQLYSNPNGASSHSSLVYLPSILASKKPGTKVYVASDLRPRPGDYVILDIDTLHTFMGTPKLMSKGDTFFVTNFQTFIRLVEHKPESYNKYCNDFIFLCAEREINLHLFARPELFGIPFPPFAKTEGVIHIAKKHRSEEGDESSR